MKHLSFIKKNNLQSGFSIIEFIVVLTIFAIMSGVTIFNYSDYRQRIEKTNIAQDIALTIRQAQVYGISSSDRVIGDASLDDPETAERIFGETILNITRDRSIRGVAVFPEENRIVIFEDNNRNFVFDASDRIVDERTVISNAVDIAGVGLCSSGASCGELQTGRVDIAFQRPYPDAVISLGGNSSVSYELASIVITGTDGKNAYIQVSSVGNIAVKKST